MIADTLIRIVWIVLISLFVYDIREWYRYRRYLRDRRLEDRRIREFQNELRHKKNPAALSRRGKRGYKTPLIAAVL